MSFQFQNGTIKRCRRYTRFRSFPRFNSKMVQLKVRIVIVISSPGLRFNSKMVQLKEPYRSQKGAFQRGFNSKMVQLKGKRRFAKRRRNGQFQFQNGTIKSPGLPLLPQCPSSVSIPKWYN